MPSTDFNPHALAWRKSSRSVNTGACIQVAAVADGVAARDSVDNSESIIRFPGAAWQLFVVAVRGENRS